jgi:hypothetical protein
MSPTNVERTPPSVTSKNEPEEVTDDCDTNVLLNLIFLTTTSLKYGISAEVTVSTSVSTRAESAPALASQYTGQAVVSAELFRVGNTSRAMVIPLAQLDAPRLPSRPLANCVTGDDTEAPEVTEPTAAMQ